MKRFFSLILAGVMLISTLCICLVNVSAAKGEWSVYTEKGQYRDTFTGVYQDIPGYKYTSEGLELVSPGWKDSTPYATFQTTDLVNIKEGVFLQVRLNEFTYDAGDKWVQFNILDKREDEYDEENGGYGLGVKTLIRIKSGAGANYDGNDTSNWAGALSSLEWQDRRDPTQTVKCSQDPADKALWANEYDEQNRPIYTLEIKWNDAYDCCEVFINNSPAPQQYNDALTKHFKKSGFMAYIGFSMQNNIKAGKANATIINYGTCYDDAEIPVGDDSAEPIEYVNEVAAMEDSSKVAQGEPAIRITGSSASSQVAGKPAGNRVIVKDDDSTNVTSDTSNFASVTFRVSNEYTYEITDFPIVMIITRNFCTCAYVDQDGDGNKDAACNCDEKFNTYVLGGDVINPSDEYITVTNPLPGFAPHEDEEGNTYLCLIADTRNMLESNKISGRINAIRIDNYVMKGADPDRNNFDICEIAFYRTEEEANAYFTSLMESIGASVGGNTVPDDTDIPTDVPTDEPTEEPTETLTEDDEESEEPTQNNSGSDKETDTSVSTGNGNTGKDTDETGGCGSIIGSSMLSIIIIAGIGFVFFKKKEE